MEQQIGFCTTSDGAGIAYATLGDGPPLVYVTGWPGHLAIEWERPFAREFLESFAGEFTLVRYDMRNTGLSERAGEDMSLEALVRDLEAVVDKLRLDRFALMSLGLLAGPVAITFAAAHSERVSHMVALGPFLRGDRLLSEEQYKALRDYVAAFGQLVTPGDFRDPERHGLDQELVRQAAAIHDAGAPPQIQVRLLETLYRSDLTAALDRLDMPVLVLHGSGDGRVTLHASREVAARLPNVQFVPYEGVGAAPWADRDIILPEIFQFLGAAPPQIATKAPRPAGGMATILFTDMESSTALTQRLGDAKAQE
ncbi:MAG: alpha/beta hydrolase, partial [Dehalococcoidia bacterium]|nr:alpha/beta hydrolase [Dehalococcoidia bacterium]